jgi:hypothetical protein
LSFVSYALLQNIANVSTNINIKFGSIFLILVDLLKHWEEARAGFLSFYDIKRQNSEPGSYETSASGVRTRKCLRLNV